MKERMIQWNRVSSILAEIERQSGRVSRPSGAGVEVSFSLFSLPLFASSIPEIFCLPPSGRCLQVLSDCIVHARNEDDQEQKALWAN
jgi:hypothetical protein